jgi:opacity protein-like surface antigen
MLRLLTLITLPALLIPGAAFADKYNSDFSLTLVNTTQDVSFNIASDLTGAATPNVLSELIWDDMDTWALESRVNIGLGKSFKIGARVGLGAIRDGNASDRDYAGDNRTDLFSYATATVDGKHQIYGDINIGWQFSNSFEVPVIRLGKSGKSMALASTIAVTPRIGYAYSKHEILFKDGVQVVPDLGPFDGLHSTYKPEWRGMYAGVDGSFRIAGPIHLLVSAQFYPDVRYRGDGNWNLRGDLSSPTSFRHSADGSGFSYEAGLRWQVDTLMSISLSYRGLNFDTDPGRAQVNSIDFGEISTRLNEADWESKGYVLEFRWRFGA